MKESGELRNRLHDSDRDIGEMLDRNVGNPSLMYQAKYWGGMGTAALDLGTAIPTYEVAYKRALAKGMSKADAIHAGEVAVRDAHGSVGQTDIAAIMRGNEAYKLMTIAYGTFNHNYNRTRDAGRMFREATQDFKAGDSAEAFNKFSTASYRMLWYLVLTAMVEEAIQPIPHKEGEHEGFLKWATKGIFHQLAGQVPVIRDIARAVLYGRRDAGQNPMGQITFAAINAAADAYNGKILTQKNKTRNAMEGISYILGLPGGGQAAATTQFLLDLKRGDQRAENPGRLMRGILMGKSHPEIKSR
jgi:hypothetical protein